jgi:hypothetical protein
MGGLTWDTFAGGTSAEEGKYSYESKTPIGTYRISPLSSPHGRHRGYGMTFVPEPGYGVEGLGLYRRVDASGKELAFNGSVPEFRSPQQAKAAAGKHYRASQALGASLRWEA